MREKNYKITPSERGEMFFITEGEKIVKVFMSKDKAERSLEYKTKYGEWLGEKRKRV